MPLLDYQRRPRYRIPLDVGRDYGKWGTIPLHLQKCPTSQRNAAPHRSGTLPHFRWNQCPTSTGIRTLHSAVKRIIIAVKKQRCNCLQVESAEMHSFLGIPYVVLSARPRHVQKGMVFGGWSGGNEAGIVSPELRRNAVAT